MTNPKKTMTSPIKIRGHTLLCFQGFRGEGYSREFVDNMATIRTQLNKDPTLKVLVIDSPDVVCSSCPNLKNHECHLHGKGSEEGMVVQDRDVMNRLGIKKGETLSWGEILTRINQKIRGEMLSKICGKCPWLPLGYCKEGIHHLGELSN